MSRPRRSCWGRRGTCADTRRLGPDDEDTAVAAEQLRTVVEHLIAAGHWKNGDPKIWIVGDSGYDGPRLAFLLADLPVALLVPVRSDRVMHFPAPLCAPGIVGDGSVSAGEFAFNNPQTWREPDHITTTQASRYGIAVVRSFDRLHPRLTHRGAWADHDGEVPIIEGTVIRSKVDRLPGDGEPKPLWLWFSGTGVEAADVDRLWQAFLRRFDLEHTSGFSSKPSVGRDPACAHGGGRSVDLADHRRAHPTPVGAAPRRGPPPPLGETPPTTRRRMTPARVLQGVSQHPADNGSARRRTETLTARSRPPSRITKHPARRTTQPRQNP